MTNKGNELGGEPESKTKLLSMPRYKMSRLKRFINISLRCVLLLLSHQISVVFVVCKILKKKVSKLIRK